MSTVHPAAARGKLHWRPELALLRAHLMSIGYSHAGAARVAAYAEDEGTLSGCPDLDAEDEPEAERVFIESMEDVPGPSPAWGSMRGDESPYRAEDDVWSPVATARAIPPELDDEHDTAILDLREDQHEEAMRHLEVDRIPDVDEQPYIPTEEDEADYMAWLADLEARQSADDWALAEAPEDFALALPPIAGGSPEADRYEPTAEDLDDMAAAARHDELLDALRRDDDARAEADRYRGR